MPDRPWIAASERLPPDGVNVETRTAGFSKFVRIAFRAYGNWHRMDGTVPKDKATHWRPIEGTANG
jgi:hypothetical protein